MSMNVIESTRPPQHKPSMERAFRSALTDPHQRKAVRDRLGWDDSQVSRFLSGNTGVTIDKLDAAIEALGMLVTSRQYMDFLAYGAKVGAACECARRGLGECGGPAL